jgi:GPN-loop GTPase
LLHCFKQRLQRKSAGTVNLPHNVQGFGEDDYLLLDCPGQIELFTHIPVLRTVVDYMKNAGWNVCAVYCLDSHFVTDSSKFIAGCFQAMSAMVTLEIPHVNVLTKVDLMPDKARFLLAG